MAERDRSNVAGLVDHEMKVLSRLYNNSRKSMFFLDPSPSRVCRRKQSPLLVSYFSCFPEKYLVQWRRSTFLLFSVGIREL
jgi:hypothetical protein